MSNLDIDLNERFYIFDNFLKSNEHILDRGDDDWDSSKIFFQLAIEHADKSPLTHGAEKFEEDDKVDFDYVRDVHRDDEIHLSPLITILEGHSDTTYGIIVLENGNFISFSHDNILKVWNKTQCITSLEGHKSGILGLEILANKNIISYSDDATLRVWDKDSYECLAILEGHESPIRGIKILANNNIVSYAWEDTTIRVWDKENYKCINILEQFGEEAIENIEALKNNNIMSYNGFSLCNWDYDTDYEESFVSFPLIEGTFQMLANQQLVSYIDYSANNNIIIYTGDYEQLAVLKGHEKDIVGLDVLHNKNIISYSNDATLRVWDKDSYECLAVLEGHKSAVKGVEILDNNIISYSQDGTLRAWDKDTYECLAILEGHRSAVQGIEVLDKNIISYSNDGVLRVWSKVDYSCIGILQGHESAIVSVKLLQNQTIVSFASEDTTIRIWNIQNLKYIYRQENINIFSNVLDLKKKFISFSKDYQLKIWDKASYCCIGTVEGHKANINGIEILANKNIISYSDDATLRVWDKDSYECLAILEGHESAIEGIKILANNNIISYSSRDIIIWQKDTYEAITFLQDATSIFTYIYGVEVLASQNIVSYGHEKTFKIWDKESYHCIATVEGHEDDVIGLEVLPNKNIISYSDDKTLRVWDKNSYKCLAILEGHESAILGIKILDNHIMLSYSRREIIIWDKTNYKCISILKNFDTLIESIKILVNLNILVYLDNNTSEILNKDTYESMSIIHRNNIDEHLSDLSSVTSHLSLKSDFVYIDYPRKYNLIILDKKTNKKLQWHSNYKPEVNALLGEAFTINDGDNGRILKVIKQKKEIKHAK